MPNPLTFVVMNKHLILFSFLLPSVVLAQKHDNVWLYGTGRFSDTVIEKVTLIHFDGVSAPSFTPTEFQLDFDLTSISMSDSNGVLQFFSNGCEVFTAEGEIMENGDTLNGPPNAYWDDFCDDLGSYHVFHSGFSILSPQSSPLYYIFHLRYTFPFENDPLGTSILMYSVVDMSANGGKGKVTAKNVPMIGPEDYGEYERAMAVRHGNGRNWWILQPRDKHPLFYRFLLSPDGVEGPFIQEDSARLIDLNAGNNHVCRFSPDGKKFIHYHATEGISVYDFDRCTGLLSNLVAIPFPFPWQWQGFDFEVSPNSQFLYVVADNFEKIIQYDLLSENIPLSGDTVAVWDGYIHNISLPTVFGLMQRGPDGKIYINTNSSPFMHIINQPDLPGEACEVVQRGLELPTWNFLGTMPFFPNYRLYDFPDSPCDTLGINTPVSATEPERKAVEGLAIHPNPAGDWLFLDIADAAALSQVTITDMFGRTVLQQFEVPASPALDISQLPKGTYTLLVRATDGRQAARLFVKQ